MKSIALIPSYNVESSIGEVVRRAKPFVSEVLVINDGSVDMTASVAESHGARVISIEKNSGKANATRIGLRECTDFDVVVTLDGDLQHVPEEIPRLLQEISNGSDLCIGSRFLNREYSMPRANRFSNKIASGLISFIAGHSFTDPQSGFRALTGEMAANLELRAEKYAIEHIMILEAAKKRYVIKEVPISCVYGSEESQIRVFSDTLRVAYDILRFVLR